MPSSITAVWSACVHAERAGGYDVRPLRVFALVLVAWLGSSHTYWADVLARPESRCKVSTGADDCVSSQAGASRRPPLALARPRCRSARTPQFRLGATPEASAVAVEARLLSPARWSRPALGRGTGARRRWPPARAHRDSWRPPRRADSGGAEDRRGWRAGGGSRRVLRRLPAP